MCLVGILLFIYGLPGHIDDAIQWQDWLRVINPDTDITIWQYFALASIVPALALGASEWWWPRMVARIRRRSRLAPESAMVQANGDLERFKACLPHVQKCRELVSPFAGPLGSLTLGLQGLSAGAQVVEVTANLEYLSQRLDTLQIRWPLISSPEDTIGDRSARFSAWSRYLAQLSVMIGQGDLTGARAIQPIEAVKPLVLEPPRPPSEES